MKTNLEWAKYYVNEKRWSVIPLSPRTKIPKKGFEVLPFRERYATKEELEGWFRDPNVNIGIITGKLSNLFVVDLDKGKDHYREENALLHFGDNPQTPITITPSGGNHLYFEYPGQGITIGEGILPAIDFRGEGGYIVAPPSVNGAGQIYRWEQSCTEFSLGTCNSSFINIIINKSTLYIGDVTPISDIGVTSVTKRDIWMDGERDKNLFTVAWSLANTKQEYDYIRQVLRAIVWSWGERDEKWINAKIKSAMDRLERKDRNIQAEVDEFIGVTTGDFSVTKCVKELGIVTRCDMAAVRKAISRRKDTLVEKVGKRDGWWRKIATEVNYLDFDEPEGIQSPVILPFDLHNLVEICEGNIVLVAGEFNAGKTTFALNSLVANKNRIPIRYISSEMKVGEIKKRFKWFGLDKSCWWPDENCQYVALDSNIPALLIPDGLNIIDYLEFPDGDYTKGAEYMLQIHNKLTTGVCIVCNQQKENARLPRSGDLILEKPRLALTLRKVATENDEVIGIAEILKAKNVTLGKMDGKKLKYEIKNMGSRFKIMINWGYWR